MNVIVDDELPYGVDLAVEDSNRLPRVADSHIKIADQFIDCAQLLVKPCPEVGIVVGKNKVGFLQGHHTFYGPSVAKVADHSLPIVAFCQLAAVMLLQLMHGSVDNRVKTGRETLREKGHGKLRLGL